MTRNATTDKTFLDSVTSWFKTQSEILVLIQYSRAAGKEDFEFFNSFAAFSERLAQLPAETYITAFRQPQLPLRGVVDDELVAKCLDSIRDGSEFVVAEIARGTAGTGSWLHHEAGETHAELREALEGSRGTQVAAGEYPSWLENSPDVIQAIVPDEQGVVTRGCY